MKYLLLVYGEEAKMREVDDLSCLAFDKSVRDSGHCVASEALQPVATATTVRVRNGKASVTDGPFTETKELVAGFTIIDVKSREEALAWTKRFPNPSIDGGEGEIEVRPFFDLDDFEDSAAVRKAKELKLGA